MLNPPPDADAPPLCEMRDVAVAIDGRPIVRGIDLTVAAGEHVAVMGANGSGKSTLIRALVGLLPTARGTVSLFGSPLGSFTEWARVGYVPQRSGAVGGVPASVAEIVASGRLARRRPWQPPRRADRRAIEAALAVVGLTGFERRGMATLSGGQQQRALIARALAGEAELLVLDEPTAGVDLPNQQALADALNQCAAAGATILVVTHELGTLTGLIRRVLVMRDGRIAYDGLPLTDAEVHQPSFGDPHHHDPADDDHHHRTRSLPDHAPRIGSPIDRRPR